MFWHREAHTPAGEAAWSEFIRDRLRLAFEFATLGAAYESSSEQDDSGAGGLARPADGDGSRATRAERAHVPPNEPIDGEGAHAVDADEAWPTDVEEACPSPRLIRRHVSIRAGTTCPTRLPDRCGQDDALNALRSTRVPPELWSRRHRRGSVQVAEQPCVWAERRRA